LEQLKLKRQLKAAGGLLGLLEQEPAAWFGWRPKELALGDGAIAELVARRNTARAVRNFGEADRIRDDLQALGVVLEDGPEGTTWRHAG